MKLIIKRNQKERKGMLGGHKGMTFLLSCRVELVPEDQALINKYKVEDHPLTYKVYRDGTKVPDIKIGSLVRGVNYELEDVATLLSNEEIIKGACKDFKTLLLVMASFGGEEIIEL